MSARSGCSRGNFAPAGWVFCDGPAAADLRERDALQPDRHHLRRRRPERRSRCPTCAAGSRSTQGNGFILAETGGVEEVTLTVDTDRRSHAPAAGVAPRSPTQPTPANNLLAQSTAADLYIDDTADSGHGAQPRSPRSAAASRTPTSSRTCASTSSSRCSASSRRPARTTMADPVRRRDPHLPVQLRPQGLGVVQRPAAAALAEHGAVLAARHHLRRRRQVDLRAARPAGQRADAPGLGQGPGLSLHDLGEIGRQRDGDPARERDPGRTPTRRGPTRTRPTCRRRSGARARSRARSADA